jgi:hypothetical protein
MVRLIFRFVHDLALMNFLKYIDSFLRCLPVTVNFYAKFALGGGP